MSSSRLFEKMDDIHSRTFIINANMITLRNMRCEKGTLYPEYELTKISMADIEESHRKRYNYAVNMANENEYMTYFLNALYIYPKNAPTNRIILTYPSS
ncbi:hypothetical protein F2P81_003991 [Scophthalmus maximus]|uniref:Uncharacterized protein n=1 Tax=Scophthalmus maximus TaxID=52904 RepID=A0A6A4TFQ7_SCOMX|nr:hypothetical protein F2P81_003991 [Scophthalmus maximus]